MYISLSNRFCINALVFRLKYWVNQGFVPLTFMDEPLDQNAAGGFGVAKDRLENPRQYLAQDEYEYATRRRQNAFGPVR